MPTYGPFQWHSRMDREYKLLRMRRVATRQLFAPRRDVVDARFRVPPAGVGSFDSCTALMPLSVDPGVAGEQPKRATAIAVFGEVASTGESGEITAHRIEPETYAQLVRH
jgi:hypothetical protein